MMVQNAPCVRVQGFIMDIDFIKWMVERVDGCRLQFDGLIYLLWFDDVNTSLTTSYFDSVFFPHLLTKAIEGINREEVKGFDILQDYSSIQIFRMGNLIKSFGFARYGSEDEAKLEALQYIWEQ